MKQRDKMNSFKKLLDRLEEDSWQLELLISGFAIFGLFYALEPIRSELYLASFNKNQIFLNFFIIVHFSIQILIFNLVLHVLLRGMWVGSLGLRYVFGDIDFEKLNYSELFTKYLRGKIVSFDTYIGKLENICSVIFALTFLLVFYVFSFFITGFILLAFNSPIPDWSVKIMRVLFILFSTGALFVFIDFITQGFLKKKKWLAKFYFPFYVVFSFLTLSFLYRPLVYNLLDNKLGRRISFTLIPFYVLIYVSFHLNYRSSNFINPDIVKQSSSWLANGSNYEDIVKENENVFIQGFAIQSKVITDPYLKLIVPLNQIMEDSLVIFSDGLSLEKDERGLYFSPGISINFKRENKDYTTLQAKYVEAFESYYTFKIDSILYETDFVITNAKNNYTFESYVGIRNLKEGKHTIELLELKHANTDSLISILKAPFWYYRE